MLDLKLLSWGSNMIPMGDCAALLWSAWVGSDRQTNGIARGG